MYTSKRMKATFQDLVNNYINLLSYQWNPKTMQKVDVRSHMLDKIINKLKTIKKYRIVE